MPSFVFFDLKKVVVRFSKTSSFRIALAVLMLASVKARAATLTVNSTADSGAGSLRAQVAAAASGDTINFSVGGTITLTSGEIAIDKNLTIAGPGVGSLVISGNNVSRIFKIGAVTPAINVSISGLTLANGRTQGANASGGSGAQAGFGGAIYNSCTGTLSLTDCVISGSSVQGGSGATVISGSGAGGYGGAIYNAAASGTLSLLRTTLTNNACAGGGSDGTGGNSVNAVAYGAGIYNAAGGSVQLTQCDVSGNTGTGASHTGSPRPTGGAARGSGLFNAAAGNVTITDTTFANNRVTGGTADGPGGDAQGAAIYLGGAGGISVSGCTFAGNITAGGFGAIGAGGAANGAAIANGDSATLAIVNSTFTENSATAGDGFPTTSGKGGAIANLNTGAVALTNVTVAGNSAQSAWRTNSVGGGLANLGAGNFILANTIVAGNNATNNFDVFGTFISAGGNLIGKVGSALGFGAAGDQVGTVALPINPLLGSLANNGGPTLTMALQVGSPAINAGNNSLAASLRTDQRGYGPRINGGTVDIGAFETGAAPLETPSLIVTATNDVVNPTDNQTSLREAIAYAKTLGGAQTVSFSSSTANGAVDFYSVTPRTIFLNGSELAVDSNINIVGPGAGALTISGNGVSRVLNITAGTVSISDLTLANGATGSLDGGGVIVNNSTLVLSNCVVSGHHSNGGNGGGIFVSAGTLRMSECTVSGNSSTDGGSNSGEGGGICVDNNGTVALNRCTVNGNTSGQQGDGAGIGVLSGALNLTNCTVSGNINSNQAKGGGISLFNGAATLIHCTISGNASSAGGGIHNNFGVITLANTIVASNTASFIVNGHDVANPFAHDFVSLGHNLIGITNGSGGWVASDIVQTNALLGPLQNNGGPTRTMALLAGSPAINAGDNSLASGQTTDQRGAARPQIGVVDIGAFEASLSESGQPTVNVGGAFWYLGPPATGNDLRVYYQSNNAPEMWVGGGLAVRLGQQTDGNVLAQNFGGGVYVRLGSTNGVGTAWQQLPAVTAGDGATWFLGADGFGNDFYIYRWATNGAPTYSGGAGTNLIVWPDGSVVTRNSAGNLFLRVGSETGLGSIWQLLQAPAITLNPSNVIVNTGGTATFTAAATGTPTPTVQWQQSTDSGGTFTNISGATSTTLSFTASVSQNGQQFRAIFTNLLGSAPTTPATLIVTETPSLVVTTTNDVVNNADGLTSLREAIEYANTLSNTPVVTFDTNVFASPQVITLTNGELLITNSLNILGPGTNLVAINANEASRIFNFDNTGSNTLSSLTMFNGRSIGTAGFSGMGGAIFFRGGKLTLASCSLHNNSADFVGGSISVATGGLVLVNSLISSNSAGFVGGGIAGGPDTDVTAIQTTVSGNQTSAPGGGIQSIGTVILIQSTVSENSGSSGGGISGRVVTVIQSTISGNQALYGSGGGIYGNGPVTVIQSTISGNQATQGGSIYAQNLTIANSIIANSSQGGIYHIGSYSILGTNIVDDGSLTGPGVLQMNPLLGPLQDNGGPTFTHALLSGSPAINSGDDAVAASLTNDQRGVGFPRVKGPSVDIGAFELQAVPPIAGNVTIYRYPTQGTKLPLYLVTSYSYDPNGNNPIGLVSFGTAASGQATVSRNGNYVFYLPTPGFTNVDSFTFVISNSIGQTATGTINVELINDNSQSKNITSITQEPAPNGGVQTRVSFAGIPGRTYNIQSTESLSPPTWQSRTNLTADSVGRFEFVDLPPLPPQRFYRSTQNN